MMRRRRGGKGRRRRRVWPAVVSLAVVLAWYVSSGLLSAITTRAPLEEESRPPRAGLKTVPILRVPADSIGSTKEFFDKYGDQVVIVENEVRHHGAFKLGWQGLRGLCKGGSVQTNLYDPSSNSWGGQSRHKLLPLGEYLDDYIILNEGGVAKELRYAGGASGVPKTCPALGQYTPVPRFVALALTPREVERELAQNDATEAKSRFLSSGTHDVLLGQPEIFIGPPGTITELHMDAWLVPFWMSVYIGRKTFRTIRYEDSRTHLNYYKEFARAEKRLYDDSTGTYVTKQLEIFDPDLEAFPELENVKVYEGTVNAGDWVYLPSATLHGVRNDEASFAVSSNSLSPPVIDQFAETCADAEFSNQCALMVRYAAPCLDEEIDSAQKLKSCLYESPRMRKLIGRYERNESRDMFLFETEGFRDFEAWCQRVCAVLEAQLKTQMESDQDRIQRAQEDFKLKSGVESHYVLELMRTEAPSIQMERLTEYVCGSCFS